MLTSRESTITGWIDYAFEQLKSEMSGIEAEVQGYYRHLPLVFVAPRMVTAPTDDPDEVRRLVRSFGELLECLSDTASVWTFPEWAQSLCYPTRGGKYSTHPAARRTLAADAPGDRRRPMAATHHQHSRERDRGHT
jgi:hypothetical protein